MPASLSLNGLEKIDYSELKETMKEMKKLAQHIILDSAAGLGDEAKAAIESADEVIVVTNPNILSVTDSLKTIKLAQDLKKPIRGVILTRYSGDSTQMPIENIREMLEVPIIGIVPEDKSVQESLVKKNSVIHHKPRSKSARAYRDIAASILGKKKKVESILDRLLYRFGI